MHNSPAARPAASSTRSWSRPLRPEPWFRSRAGTLTRPASASVAHLHSAIAGLFGQNRNRRAIRQQRGSPRRRALVAPTDRFDVPAFAHPRVRAIGRSGIHPRPRFHAPRGLRAESGPALVLARSAHQVLASYLLAAGPMQRSQTRAAALPDSRTGRSLGRFDTARQDFSSWPDPAAGRGPAFACRRASARRIRRPSFARPGGRPNGRLELEAKRMGT